MAGIAYATPFQGSAYAIPLEPAPWDPPNIFEPRPYRPCTVVIETPPLEQDSADSLLDRCKKRLAVIELLLAQHKDLEVEAETLRKMIKATEKGK